MDYYGTLKGGNMYTTGETPRDLERETTVSSGTSTTTLTRYTRYFNNGTQPCAIKKEVTVLDSSGYEVSYKASIANAPWNNRTTATYVDINECGKL